MGSLEEVSTGNNGSNPNPANTHQFPRSASTCSNAGDIQQRPQNSPSVHSQLSGIVIAPKSSAQTVENCSASAQSTHQVRYVVIFFNLQLMLLLDYSFCYNLV